MTVFQINSLIILTILAFLFIFSYKKNSITTFSLISWLTILSIGSYAILHPNETTVIAQAIGINRGTDLLLYIAIISGLFITGYFYIKLRILNRQITLLVRQQAIDHTYNKDTDITLITHENHK